ncbi:hypothetical protein ACEWY4_019780 [Coilia grayii]|uniref:Metalloendopeptidase n=1 Tax=Coilia grayii TaxID=363190 RepID=A0ABD1JAP5_9TELE
MWREKNLFFLCGSQIRKRRSISKDRTLWPLPVPYHLHRTLDSNAKGVILKAFEQLRLKTCIDFRPRHWSFEQHIALKWSIGCWSAVGRQLVFSQDLSIGPHCDTVATVEHELLHALGFWHEQSRPDRDDYVTINWQNIEPGEEQNFKIGTNDTNSTMGTPYDYLSIMHYPQDAFTNGNGSTIITKLPEFQDVIGQRLDMSHYDVEELNRLYGCNDSVSFLEHCNFDEGMTCEINSSGWKRASQADGGPHSDHTHLGTDKQGTGTFIHFSTKSGKPGDSAIFSTRKMTPRRSCKVQCLEFFYYHTGSWSDQLNIWIREFDSVNDAEGTRRFMGQIKGSSDNMWKVHHVPLDASKTFQVEFEGRKRSWYSSGGFSVDDINLSETECPDHTWHIRDFERKLKTSSNNTYIFSPKYYSDEGYRYQLIIRLNVDYFGVFVRLVSGGNDDTLKWPCQWRQITFTLLDQTSHIQKRMSQQRSITTSAEMILWMFFNKPRIWGSREDYFGMSYVNDARGYGFFMSAAELRSRGFLKGGDIFLLISMQDITRLQSADTLQCPSIAVQTWHEDGIETTTTTQKYSIIKRYSFTKIYGRRSVAFISCWSQILTILLPHCVSALTSDLFRPFPFYFVRPRNFPEPDWPKYTPPYR